MLPKLSVVSIGVHDDVLNWVAKSKPVSIIVVNERGQGRPDRPWENNEIDGIRNAMGASPQTLWIFRSWPDGIGENIPGWPLWERLIKCFEPFRGMSNPLMAHGYNEPGNPWVFTIDGAMSLANIEIKFAERIHNAGLLYGGLCFPESHLGKDHQFLWKHLAPALAYLDAWIPNEYDWPWVLTSRDQDYKWRIGHYEHQLLEISEYFSNIPPVIIGEGILDGKILTPDKPTGWQTRYPSRGYIEQHQQVYDDTYHRPEVFSHHTYCRCGPESEWRSYDIEPILEDLGKMIQGQVYWEDFPRTGKIADPEKIEEEPMSDELIRAIDVSEYGGEIKESQWKAAYDAGYRMAIVQAWGGGPIKGGKNAYCAQQLAAARIAGMMTAIYFHLPSDTTTKTEFLIQAVKEAAGDGYQHIKFVAVDIEGDRLLHPTLWEERLENAISHIKDKPVVIYTSKNAWEVVMGGVDGFEDYPLWDARYDGLPDLEAGWKPYGGWKERAAKQYQGTTIIAGGISADLNVVSLKRLLTITYATIEIDKQREDLLQVIDSAADVIKNAVAKMREGK